MRSTTGWPRSGSRARARVLAAAYAAHPERFVRGVPRPLALPTEVWINRPKTLLSTPKSVSEPEIVTNFAFTAPYSPAADSTHSQVSPRIDLGEPLGSLTGEPYIAAVATLNTEHHHQIPKLNASFSFTAPH